MKSSEQRIVFAGGGSGGTIAPGIAVAQRLRDLAPEVECVFLCSERPIDSSMLAAASMSHHTMPACPPSRSPLGLVRFARAWRSTRRAARAHLFAGSQVVALGGYVAPPVVAEAKACGLHVTLLNLDAVAGRANRWIARHAGTVLTSTSSNLIGAGEPMGVPLRREVLAQVPPSESRFRLGLDPDRQTLLVTGASQGARSLNAFMLAFLDSHAEHLAGWQVVHLSGEGGDRDRLRAAYLKAGVVAHVLEFLEAMGDAWGAADLALSRGGASSIAEIAANAVPAVVAPYPWHADQHQAANARDLITVGGVVLVEDAVEPEGNLQSIGPTLGKLLGDIGQRAAMRRALEARPRQDAAVEISRRLLAVS